MTLRHDIRRLAPTVLAAALAGVAPLPAQAQLNQLLQQLMNQGGLLNPAPSPPSYPPSSYPGASPPGSVPAQPREPIAVPPQGPPKTADSITVAEMQRLLDGLGYAAGAADGQAGPQTVAAIRAFQHDHGLHPSGRIDRATLAAARTAAQPTAQMKMAASPSPSFDCATARTPTERTICARPDLAELDAHIATAYGQARVGMDASALSQLTAAQRAWVHRRNVCGTDAACLQSAMQSRLAELATPTPASEVTTAAASGTAPPAEAGAFAALATPPPGIRPIVLRMVAGRPLLSGGASDATYTEAAQRALTLLEMARLKPVPPNPGQDAESTALYEDFAKAQQFLTESALHSLTAFQHAEVEWKGDNEFEQARSHDLYRHRYLPALLAMAPAPPFEFALAEWTMMPRYDSGRGGFVFQPDNGHTYFGDLVQSGGRLRLSLVGRMPDLFWPVDPQTAEATLRQLGEDRQVTLVAAYRLRSIDRDSGRLDIEPISFSGYTRDFATRLFEIAAPHDGAAAMFDTASSPALHTPGPMPLDFLYVTAKRFALHPVPLTAEAREPLLRAVAERDRMTYQHPPATPLAKDDSRRPFFPPGPDQIAITPAVTAAFDRWFSAYAASLPDMVTVPLGSAPDQHGGADAKGFVAGVTGLETFAKAAGLQADQLVLLWNPQTPAVLVLPNAARLYDVVPSPAQAAAAYSSTKEASATLHVEKAQAIRDDRGVEVLALWVQPLSARIVTAGGKIMAERSEADVPALDAASFTSAQAPTAAARPVLAGKLPLDRALIDLLIAAEAGESLPDEAQAYAVTRRWVIESDPAFSGPRFFTPGKRRPNPEEAIALGPAFVTWAKAHAPALPLTVTLAGTADRYKGDTFRGWPVLSCLQEWPSPIGGNAAYIARDCERRQSGAPGIRPLAGKEALVCAAAGAVAAAAPDLLSLGGPRCTMLERTGGEVQLSFADPLRVALLVSHSLPEGKPQTPADSYTSDVTASLVLRSIHKSSARPEILDHLPPEIATLLPPVASNAEKGATYITAEADFLESTRQDKGSARIDRFGPADATPLTRIVAGFQAQVATLAASRQRTAGPYGPDMVGVRLGMNFAEADAAIRAHMKVGRVLTGRRAVDPPRDGPPALNSGRLYVSQANDELIAIIDDPPAAKDRVLAAWRRVLLPPGRFAPQTLEKGLQAKYGKPVTRFFAGALNVYAQGGELCEGIYQAGQMVPIAQSWSDAGKPPHGLPGSPDDPTRPGQAPPAYNSGGTARAPQLPQPILVPPDDTAGLDDCGPYVTASLLTSLMTKQSYDLLDITLTDIAGYLATTRAAQGGGTPSASSEPPLGIKF